MGTNEQKSAEHEVNSISLLDFHPASETPPTDGEYIVKMKRINELKNCHSVAIWGDEFWMVHGGYEEDITHWASFQSNAQDEAEERG